MPTIAELIKARKQQQEKAASTPIEEVANMPLPETSEEVVDADLIRAKLDEIELALKTTGAVRQPVIFVYEQIKKNSALAEILKPEDIGLLTRSLRAIYKTVSDTSATRKTKAATKKNATAQQAASVLDGIDLL